MDTKQNKKFTSLMKNILSDKKVGKLTFKADDNLSKRLNKLMNWLYKNSDIDSLDLISALENKYQVNDFAMITETVITDPIETINRLKRTFEYYTKTDVTEKNIFYSSTLKRYLLLSDKNKFRKNIDDTGRYYSDNSKIKFYSINEKTLLGWYLLKRDILNNELCMKHLKENNGDMDEFVRYLKALKNDAYWTDISAIPFITDEDMKKEILTYYNIVDMYVNMNYQYKLQYDYEKSIDKVVRATAWTTKKTINEQTKKAMESTSLNKLYKFVELDNDVDLDKMAIFESEMAEIKNKLPRFDNEKQATLRLRKLGNYKALGMYVPANNTIAIDFRDGGDTDVMNYDEAGIQSFVHEYGHFIDYRSSDGRLSDKDEFYKMAKTYTANLEKFAMKNKNNHVSKKLGYYLTPTEIFARGFELFMRAMGLETSLMHDNKVYDNEPEYTAFNQEEILEYYSGIFPEFKVS